MVNEESKLKGKRLRVATFMLPPFTELLTDSNGQQWSGQGLEMSFLKEIAIYDEFHIKWVDVLYEEGELWGGILPDGSSSGQAKVLYEFRADVGIGEIICGFKYDYLTDSVVLGPTISTVLTL